MIGARAGGAAALVGLGVLHEALAPLMIPGLALVLADVRRAALPWRAAAAGGSVMTVAIAVAAGGTVGLWPLAPLAAPLLALPFALPGLIHLRLRRCGAAVPLADLGFVLAWPLAEALLVHGLHLPIRIGYALTATPLVRLAGLAGAGAIGFGALLAAWTLVEAGAWRPRATSPRLLIPAGTLTLILVASAGATGSADTRGAGAAPGTIPPASLRVALVQTDVRAGDRAAVATWPELAAALEVRSLGLVRDATARGAHLVVTPETMLRGRAGRLPLVATPPGREPFAVLAGAAVRTDHGLHNAVVDLADSGAVRYVKTHLVPGREAAFVAGAPTGPVPVAGLRVALAICYDLLFAADVRRDAGGADLLVAVSDASFAQRSALPHLQLGVARVRAVENGRPLLFTTATGPSAIVDAGGRTVARTARMDADVLVRDLVLTGRSTPYARFGVEAEAFAAIAGLGLVARRGVRPLERLRERF